MQSESPQLAAERIHLQLANICGGAIERGPCRPEEVPFGTGDCAPLGESRVTANKFISNMIAEGVLVLCPAIGTIVAPVRGLHPQMESFTDRVLSAGIGSGGKSVLLSQESEP